MPYVNITKPVQGEVTRKALIDAVIDNQAYFNSIISALTGLGVPNGSFELDSDSDGIPDEWERTLYTGGSFAITGVGLGNTEHIHGQRAVSFASPGGSGNGGGYLDTSDFVEVTPSRLVVVSWMGKSSAATIRNKVVLRWFDGAQSFISSDEIFSSVNNSTSWQLHVGFAYAPATARYAKIRIVGAEDSTTVAGTAYFDNLEMGEPVFSHEVVLETPGSFSIVFPTGIELVFAELVGGGAGGGTGGAGDTPGGGGGAGAFVAGMVPVVPGTTYTVEVGAGGAPGADGADSTFAGVLSAGGGDDGVDGSAGGAGGSGGSASGGFFNLDGGDGGASVVDGASGSGGFNSHANGFFLPGVGLSQTGDTGLAPGQGGAGGGRESGQPGAGANGRIILRW